MAIPPAGRSLRQLFLGIDVSSSVRRYLPNMHRHLTNALRQIHEHGSYELSICLFNRHVLPFPSERTCRLQTYDKAEVPTLNDLRRACAGGTALLDMQDWLIDAASQHNHEDRRSIILTDGWERSSVRTTLDQLRKKTRKALDWLDISLVGFVDSRTMTLLARLARDLELPSGAWAFSEHQNDEESVDQAIAESTLELVKMATLPRNPRWSGGEDC